MRAEIREVATRIDAAYALFQEALAVGEKIRLASNDEESIGWVQERGRVSERTGAAMAAIESAMEQLQATPSEMAFLNEKRARIQDLVPRFKLQDAELRRNMSKRLDAVRTESAKLKRNTHAIRQYIGAPGSKPYIK